VDLFKNVRHPYTEALLASIPQLDQDKSQELYSIPGIPPDLRAARRVPVRTALRLRQRSLPATIRPSAAMTRTIRTPASILAGRRLLTWVSSVRVCWPKPRRTRP
jgi:ABC-type dipeptide/oligopeptide/nickel transport system ATPase component